MLYHELPPIDSSPVEGWEPWLASLIIGAAAITVAGILFFFGQPVLSALVIIAALVGAILLARGSARTDVSIETFASAPDYSVIGAALGASRDPMALTDKDCSLLVVNSAYRERFGTCPPDQLGENEEGRTGLELARTMAWRDGGGCVVGIETRAGSSRVEVERVGAREDLLLWRFPAPPQADQLNIMVRRIEGIVGERLASAGVLAAVVDSNGAVLCANRAFAERALGMERSTKTARLRDLVEIIDGDRMRLLREGEAGQPLNTVHLPAEMTEDNGAGTFLLFDTASSESLTQSSNLQALLDVLPIGLALVDRDGRFLTMNAAFSQAAGLKGSAMPVYPGDLVVKEDKAAVADAVRRNSRGPAMSGDLAVRLAHQSSEPVALTLAGLRGLGDAAVLLLLKDNSEEAKLKRQVAQATKMQVVGQLAGGVAHDFNNILTAIIGHCDLMLMRHTPGDSDYDDLQQIKSNSNRAAGLTRQLLAFSRQQTLRPQVLNFPTRFPKSLTS